MSAGRFSGLRQACWRACLTSVNYSAAAHQLGGLLRPIRSVSANRRRKPVETRPRGRARRPVRAARSVRNHPLQVVLLQPHQHAEDHHQQN